MRTNTGQLIIDLNDSISESIGGSLGLTQSSSIDENQTTYQLYPVAINRLPIIQTSIIDASIPNIVREEFADQSNLKTLYTTAEGLIRVAIGSSFVLKIRATQPQTLNVDNGVPVIKQGESELNYNWLKDGDFIGQTISLQDYPLSTIEVKNKTELVFTNITPEVEGVYSCEISNDIGITSSELITLSAFNPDSQFDTLFKTNLVQNPIGVNGVDGWTNSFGSIIAKPLLKDLPGKPAVIREAKKPTSTIRGYNADMFYPHPKSIQIVNLRRYESQLQSIATNDAFYFTRENLKYVTAGGLRKVVAYQDIDLTDAIDYIKGRVYGVNAVRAIVSCYVGGGVTRFEMTATSAVLQNRSKAESYAQDQPRISVSNFSKMGPSTVSETVKVTFQELQDDTPLITSYYNPLTRQTKLVDGITFQDPVSKAIDIAWNNPVSQYPTDTLNIGRTLQAIDPISIQLQAFNYLYKNRPNLYCTNGQFVELNTGYITSLNKNTNKIRIYLSFDIDDLRLYEKWETVTNYQELFELNGWDLVYRPNLTKASGAVGSEFVGNLLRAGALQDKPLNQAWPTNAESKGVVTGLTVSLYPIVNNSSLTVGSTMDSFANSCIKVPTFTEDLANRYI